MIDGISEATEAREEQPLDARLATVGAVYNDGLTLIFDGQEAPTEKHYKCNTSVTFKAGDRVKVARISGSYVVEYVVGAPNSGGGAGVSELVNGDYKVTLGADGTLTQTGGVKIGSASNKFAALYAGAYNSKSSTWLSLFDAEETIRPYLVYTTINSSNQIAALQSVVDTMVKLGLYRKLGG